MTGFGQMTALRTAGPLEPAEFLTAFMHLVGGPAEAADYSDQLPAQVELLRSSVPAWDSRSALASPFRQPYPGPGRVWRSQRCLRGGGR